MQVQKINNQSFGMAVKYSPDYETVRTFIHSNYNREVNDKVGIITKLQAKNPVDIYLSIANKDGKKRVLTGAEKAANRIHKERQELDRLLNRA